MVMVGVILFGAIFATNDDAISRVFIGSFLAASWLFLLVLNRYLPDFWLKNSFKGDNQARLALVGRRKVASRMKSWAERAETYGVHVEGLVRIQSGSDETTDEEAGFKVLGTVENLEMVIKEHKITHIVLIDNRHGEEWIKKAVDVTLSQGARLWIFDAWSYFFDRPLLADTHDGQTYFTFHNEPLEDPVNRTLKRALDIAVSLPVVFFLLPILCLVVKIKQHREAPGPLFFRQRRHGRQQAPFMVYKFRSMYQDDDRTEEIKQATTGDSRVFPFGDFLRRTSLDELPQFINVLQGDMSVVGPRPHLDKHDGMFARIVQFYTRRAIISSQASRGLRRPRAIVGKSRTLNKSKSGCATTLNTSRTGHFGSIFG
tara:strand:- start:115281 stop:116396 length:1116 start_codon:yes stop_codon:yes gene_type:complete